MFKFGLDNLVPSEIKGKIGLVTNSSGVTSELEQNIDFLLRKGVQIKKIFTPEHGMFGAEANGSEIGDSTYGGIPVISLYGKKLKPDRQDFEDLDMVIYDIQDAGLRFYTYVSTLHNVVEATAKIGLPLTILDRPNPIDASVVDGPMMKEENRSFVGIDLVPTRYGMTIGELGGFFNRKFEGDVQVLKMTGYKRNSYYDDLMKWFIPPSLNLPTLDSVVNYSGMCLLEATDLSLGRGTPYPFLQFGKPGLKEMELQIPGMKFRKTIFRPTIDPFGNLSVEGYFMHIMDRQSYNPNLLTLTLFTELYRKEMLNIDERKLSILYGSEGLMHLLNDGAEPKEIMASWKEDLLKFMDESRNFYLYK